MKRLKIKKIEIKNFKKFSNLTLDFSDDYNELKGFNGVGKTSVFDAICWTLRGRDYSNAANFDMYHMENGVANKGLSPNVKLTIHVNENSKTKEHIIERTTTKSSNTVTTIKVDDVIYKKKEYENFFLDLFGISTDEFPLLFNPNQPLLLGWKELKSLLLSLAGEVTDDDILVDNEKYNPIKTQIETHGADMLHDSIRKQSKDIEKEIPIKHALIEEKKLKIDNLQGVALTLTELQTKKTDLIARITTYRERLANEIGKKDKKFELVSQYQEKERIKNDYLSSLNDVKNKGEQIKLEIEKASDSKTIKNEKLQIINNKINKKEYELKDAKKTVIIEKETYEQLIAQYKKEEATEIVMPDNKCNLCKQELPEESYNKIKEDFIKNKDVNLNNYKMKIIESKEKFAKFKLRYEEIEVELKDLKETLSTIDKTDFTTLPEIVEKTKELNEQRQELYQEYNRLQALINHVSGEQQALKVEIEAIPEIVDIPPPSVEQAELDAINEKITPLERLNEIKQEHEDLVKELGDMQNKFIKTKMILDLIVDFKKEKANLLNQKMKAYFNFIEFKTLNFNEDGSERETFEIMYNNKPFSALSMGERITVGLDLLNGIQELKQTQTFILIDSIGELSSIPKFVQTQIITARAMPKMDDNVEEQEEKERIERYNKACSILSLSKK